MRAAGQRVWAIVRKEVRQLRRDRLTFGMIFGVPTMQLLLFGYAINQDVRHLRAAAVDLAGSARSRALVADAEASQVLDVVARAHDAGHLESLLRRGEVSVGLLVPRDFERRVERGDRPAAQLLVDGSDPIVLGAARGLARLPIERARERVDTFEVRAFYNPERRSAVQIVPGLIGVILTMTMTLFTAVAIVRERERGNLELLINTPVRTPELMLGKILPYMAIGIVQVTLILVLGALLFRVPIRGTLADTYRSALIFVTATLGLGLLISTLARTQFQAFQLAFFIMLPSILLSGFMFPFDGMPKPAQWIAQVLPLTHFNELVRGIVLRGAPIVDLGRPALKLLLFLVVALAIASLRFRKRLD